jgi:glycosyltransferase involved in cell wall biosynthesis
MTILLIVRRFDFGGAENHVCDLANWLYKKGHKVIVIGKKGRQFARLHAGVTFINKDFKDYLLPLHVVKLIAMIFLHKVDVIHAHQRLPSLLGGWAAFFTRKTLIITVHGRSKFDLRHPISRKVASKIIFVSQAVKYFAEKRYRIAKKTIYIPNGIAERKTIQHLLLNRINYVSKLNDNHFNVVSLLIRRVIPQLLKSFPGLEFHITGDGKKIDEVRLMAIDINRKQGREICHVRGYEDGILDASGAPALVMGVGRVALEAIAAGIPVLSVNCKRFGGLITAENYVNWKGYNFIDTNAEPPTKEVLLAELTKYFKNQQKLIEETKTLAIRVKQDFSMCKLVDEIIATYKDAE